MSETTHRKKLALRKKRKTTTTKTVTYHLLPIENFYLKTTQ